MDHRSKVRDALILHSEFIDLALQAQNRGVQEDLEKVANAYKTVAESLVLYLTRTDEDPAQTIDLAATVALTKAIRSPDSSNDN